MKYSLESTIKDLLANETIKAKFKEMLPGIVDNPAIKLIQGQKLKDAAKAVPQLLDKDVMKKIADFLEKVKD